MNKVQVSLKIDGDLNRFMRARASKLGVSQSTIMQEALYMLQVRITVEEHIRLSIQKNLQFSSEEEFRAYCKSTGKIPCNAEIGYDADDFVLNEMYGVLYSWHQRAYRESYITEFFEREYWRPADNLTLDAFEEQYKLAEMCEPGLPEMRKPDDEDSLVRPTPPRNTRAARKRKARKAEAAA